MLLPVLLLALLGLLVLLYRQLSARKTSTSLWRSALALGAFLGLTRALLACSGWYLVEHHGGPLQVPAYALAMLAWPEGALLGPHRGATPLGTYLRLGSLLFGSTLLVVTGVAFLVDRRHRSSARYPRSTS